MFYCQVTGKLIEPKMMKKIVKQDKGGDKVIWTRDPKTYTYKIISKVRNRNYIYLKTNGKVREVTEDELSEVYKRLPYKEKERFEEKRVIRSTGYEPVEVLDVCYDVYQKHISEGGLTC